jgi:hypothetical protein
MIPVVGDVDYMKIHKAQVREQLAIEAQARASQSN